MKKSFDYSQYSPVHKHQSQRRVLKKLVFILGLLGWMLLLIQAVFAFMWLLAEDLERIRLFRLAAVYLGLGLGVLGLQAFMRRMLEAKSRRRFSRHVPARDDVPRPSTPPTRNRDREGSVLIMVLVMVALMTGLVFQAQVSANLAHRAEGAQLDETRLRLAATDAARAAMQTLANDPDLRTDHLGEDWAQTQDATDPSGITTRVTTTDLSRYFDLNNLSIPARPSVRPASGVLIDLMTLCGEHAPQAKVDALNDWLDSDDEGFRETVYYRERAEPLRPPNRALYAWNELMGADGFRREDVSATVPADPAIHYRGRLTDCVTLVPTLRDSIMPINLNTAAEETIHAMVGIENDDLVRRILSRRELRPLQQADAMSLALDPKLIQRLAPYVAVGSAYFRILSVAFLHGHAESIEAVVHRDDQGNVEVLQWAL